MFDHLADPAQGVERTISARLRGRRRGHYAVADLGRERRQCLSPGDLECLPLQCRVDLLRGQDTRGEVGFAADADERASGPRAAYACQHRAVDRCLTAGAVQRQLRFTEAGVRPSIDRDIAPGLVIDDCQTAVGELVDPVPLEEPVCRDPDDDQVLALVGAAEAACLVTGDDDLLSLGTYGGSPILTPRGFWELDARAE